MFRTLIFVRLICRYALDRTAHTSSPDFPAHLLVQLVGDVGAVLAGALEQTDLLLDPLHLHLQLLLPLLRLLLE
jgi:hypothetical protein